jgi:hypothetical protein
MNPHFIYLRLKHKEIWKQRNLKQRKREGVSRRRPVNLHRPMWTRLTIIIIYEGFVTDSGKGLWDLLHEYSDKGNVGVMNTSKYKCQLLATINISQRIFTISHSSKTKIVSCDLYVLKPLQISDDIHRMNPVRPKSLRGKNIFMKL